MTVRSDIFPSFTHSTPYWFAVATAANTSVADNGERVTAQPFVVSVSTHGLNGRLVLHPWESTRE